MTIEIHNTAIVDKTVQLDSNVKIGPYCVLTGRIQIGKGTVLKSHVCIADNTKLGENNVIYPFTSLGEIPQDKKFSNGETYLIIGNNNQIRESVTINKGTELGNTKTVIGDNNLIMSMTHIAHDCILGNNIIMSNGAMMAGHVIIEDNVIIGGMSGIHQFCSIGKGAILGGMSSIRGHVIPFSLTKDESIIGANVIGLKRMEYEREEIKRIIEIIDCFGAKTIPLSEIVDKFTKSENEIEKYIAHFIQNASSKVGLAHFNIKNV